MATTTITARTAVTAGNLDDTAVVMVDDKNANTRKATIAQLRTQINTGDQAFTAGGSFVGNVGFGQAADGTYRVTIKSAAILKFLNADSGFTLAQGGTNDYRLSQVASSSIFRFGVDTIGLDGVTELTAVASARSGSVIGLGGTTQATIGANGAASALTANPLGYLIAYKGATKIVFPYYNA